ncbi:hypothetical protein LCGC14_1098540 [marine sediment metagenome]|uniref:DUF2835 domain-containing protein n=2 Tax=root TaxID=1 RepID=A0A0F9MEP6_9ZZZZ
MKTLRFSMALSREQALRYYSGSVRTVIVTAETGQRLSFPAEHIRPFIELNGVHGHFSIRFDDNNRFVGIQRLTV